MPRRVRRRAGERERGERRGLQRGGAATQETQSSRKWHDRGTNRDEKGRTQARVAADLTDFYAEEQGLWEAELWRKDQPWDLTSEADMAPGLLLVAVCCSSCESPLLCF